MFSPRWVVLNKNKTAAVLALVLVLALAIWGAGRFVSGRAGKKMPPQQMLETGLERTMVSSSFRYQAETRLTSEGRVNVDYISKVEGERVAPDKVSIKGIMMNTPIEFIQVSELFYAELNPLAYFSFKDVPDLKYKGEEKVNGENLHLLEMRPNLIDPFLEIRLTDYNYKVWLSPRDYRLRQATLQARDKYNQKGGIEINLRFWDYDENITINPPIVN